MKKIMRFSAAAIACAALFLTSCKKEASISTSNGAGTSLQTKVTTWLDGQIKTSNAIKAEKLRYLQRNLNLGKLRAERLDDSTQAVLVPISSGFVSQNNKGKATSANLMLIIRNQNDIKMNHIVQYVPDNAADGSEAPIGTFAKLFDGHNRPLDFNGKLSFLSPTDIMQWGVRYKNGTRTAYDLATNVKPSIPSGNTTTNGRGGITPNLTKDPIGLNCTSYYLVTTYYNSDGSVASETWDYMYTDCDSSGSGNGDGSADGPLSPPTAVTSLEQWTVISGTPWYVQSYEQLFGEKNPVNANGKFTGITHLDCKGVNVTFSGYCVAYVTSNVTCQSTVAGLLDFGPQFPQKSIPNKTRVWGYNDIVW